MQSYPTAQTVFNKAKRFEFTSSTSVAEMQNLETACREDSKLLFYFSMLNARCEPMARDESCTWSYNPRPASALNVQIFRRACGKNATRRNMPATAVPIEAHGTTRTRVFVRASRLTKSTLPALRVLTACASCPKQLAGGDDEARTFR